MFYRELFKDITIIIIAASEICILEFGSCSEALKNQNYILIKQICSFDSYFISCYHLFMTSLYIIISYQSCIYIFMKCNVIWIINTKNKANNQYSSKSAKVFACKSFKSTKCFHVAELKDTHLILHLFLSLQTRLKNKNNKNTKKNRFYGRFSFFLFFQEYKSTKVHAFNETKKGEIIMK